ncbi:MFS transporter [Nonomuraea pusilla]|uniref:Predicted arabinose efflux permease, MFS family n=1 Tax=Nonomuraea pusilla TaxID=46177 RepID=A0A1H8GDW3_9ACTN|nr:MFS transporter [Nonomuraea pusilla]SEN41945.1 Predicted arabinose efflux permease, MFS family [Nonomuraea pusilla]
MVAALAVTQTVGFGVLYYVFSVLLDPMARDLRASASQVALALTLSVLVSALCAPFAGRWLDARGGRLLMTAGSVLGTLALLAWSRVENVVQLYAVFAAVGVASAMVLYEAAFAVIVARFSGRGRASALLAVMVVAGFASSIFLPLAGVLVQAHGWRQALVILAALYGATAIPLHAVALRRSRSAPEAGLGGSDDPGQADQAGRTDGVAGVAGGGRATLVRAATRQAAFWLLTVAFTLHNAATATFSVLLVTYLVHLGHPPLLAATVAGTLGILSVTGRLVITGLQSRLPTALAAAAVFTLQALAAVLLPLTGAGVAGAVTAVLLFGLGFGVGALTKPHLLAERYGTVAFASLSGRIALPATLAKAGAPAAALAVALTAGYGWVMAAVTLACLVAAATLVAYHRVSFRRPSNHGEAPA